MIDKESPKKRTAKSGSVSRSGTAKVAKVVNESSDEAQLVQGGMPAEEISEVDKDSLTQMLQAAMGPSNPLHRCGTLAIVGKPNGVLRRVTEQKKTA